MLRCDNLTLAPALTIKFANRRVAHKLDLPKEMKVHLVFHVSILRKFQDLDRVFYGQQTHPLAPTLTDNGVEYIVDSIMGTQVSHGTTQYLVRWSGCGAKSDNRISEPS